MFEIYTKLSISQFTEIYSYKARYHNISEIYGISMHCF